MAMSRRDALKRLQGLAPRVEEHLEQLAADPESWDASHWRGEVRTWLDQLRAVLPYIGKKSGREWAEKLAGWEARLES